MKMIINENNNYGRRLSIMPFYYLAYLCINSWTNSWLYTTHSIHTWFRHQLRLIKLKGHWYIK